MKRNRLIFYSVFALFHLFLVVFTIFLDSNKGDFSLLGQLLKMMSLMKYGAMFGLALLITDVIWSFIVSRDSEKEKAALNHELNTLKAKLFDIQEAGKTQPNPKNVKP